MRDRSGSVASVIRGGPQGRHLGRARWLLLALLVVLEAADVVTTNHCLAFPGAWEANPIVAALQSQLGCVWWLPKALAFGWIAVATMRIRRCWPLAFAVSYCGLVVALNIASL
jgi:Domain of unknown function (DUF5658)